MKKTVLFFTLMLLLCACANTSKQSHASNESVVGDGDTTVYDFISDARTPDFISEGIAYKINSNNTSVTVTSCTDDNDENNYRGMTAVKIPQSVTYAGKTYSVTAIGECAFACCESITSVTIPNSVTSIGDQAFSCCESLTSVTIPNLVTEIGEWILSDCENLTSIIVDKGNSKYDSRNNCNAIIETATNTLIAGCKNTVIPTSVTSIGYGAFVGTGLTNVTIPTSVTEIGEKAFKSSFGLTSIIVDKGNPRYDSRNNCNAIIETATNTLIVGCKSTVIPTSVTEIGGSAFNCCFDLISLSIPSSVTSIGDEAFHSCTGLTSVTIPNSVTEIGEGAFRYCFSLTSVTIPERFAGKIDDIFYGCDNLKTIKKTK